MFEVATYLWSFAVLQFCFLWWFTEMMISLPRIFEVHLHSQLAVISKMVTAPASFSIINITISPSTIFDLKWWWEVCTSLGFSLLAEAVDNVNVNLKFLAVNIVRSSAEGCQYCTVVTEQCQCQWAKIIFVYEFVKIVLVTRDGIQYIYFLNIF